MTLAMTHHPVARVVRRAPHRPRIARRSVVPAATSAFSRGDDDAFDAAADRARRVDARRARERTVKIRTRRSAIAVRRTRRRERRDADGN
jgi:hypothetical protein